ncbi:hypothetical protein MT355_20495 [Rathayibacter sp. VKM Ac-2929]|uniref:hypothetical protein n=1 Tax=Rathayibacter sp. VKM Ac-2929 TaxID=2929480 RepID=UPI001FB240B8|nr:hypothetical protein [Rathayibacter sp. VKM Ac-2929]MCJ1675653.1 hypothetical protein [Rathayibacter sp. VKM Ac-2929]
MSEHEADGGVEESMSMAMRTALTVAMQMAEKFSRLREEMARDAERRDSAAARELAARFEAERGAAIAQLAVVDRPDWWENASPANIADVAETAQTWRGFDERAEAASEIIGREVKDRYGVDVNALADQERARAAQERTEATLLVAEADRLDNRAQAVPAQGQTPTDVVAQLEAQAAAYDAAAQRGGEDGKSPDELRELAADARAQAQLHQDAPSSDGAQQPAPEATAARADASNSYDSAERRQAFAATLESNGVSPEDVKARLRADIDQARPARDVLTTPGKSARVASPSTPNVSRQRQRGDRGR